MERLQPPPGSGRSFAWRLGFLYAALFLVVGCYLPYLPIWLDGADRRREIAVLLAARFHPPRVSLSSASPPTCRGRRTIVSRSRGARFFPSSCSGRERFWQMLLATGLLRSTTTIIPLSSVSSA